MYVCSITVFVKRYSTIHCHFSVSNFLQSRKKVILFYDKWKRNNIQRMSIWGESLLFFKIFWNHIISVIFSQVLHRYLVIHICIILFNFVSHIWEHLSTIFCLYLLIPYPLQNKDGVLFSKLIIGWGSNLNIHQKVGFYSRKTPKT